MKIHATQESGIKHCKQTLEITPFDWKVINLNHFDPAFKGG